MKGYSPMRRWLRQESARDLAQEAAVTLRCLPRFTLSGRDGTPLQPVPGHPLDEYFRGWDAKRRQRPEPPQVTPVGNLNDLLAKV